MNTQVENKIHDKILKGEDLTDFEKQQMGMDYDEWKQMHEASRESLIEIYRWGSWPMLFICGFFLLSSAVRNTRYLMEGGQADTSVLFVAAAGWVLGLASVAVSFYMKKVCRQKQLQRIGQERAAQSEGVQNQAGAAQEGRAGKEDRDPQIL